MIESLLFDYGTDAWHHHSTPSFGWKWWVLRPENHLFLLFDQIKSSPGTNFRVSNNHKKIGIISFELEGQPAICCHVDIERNWVWVAKHRNYRKHEIIKLGDFRNFEVFWKLWEQLGDFWSLGDTLKFLETILSLILNLVKSPQIIFIRSWELFSDFEAFWSLWEQSGDF